MATQRVRTGGLDPPIQSIRIEIACNRLNFVIAGSNIDYYYYFVCIRRSSEHRIMRILNPFRSTKTVSKLELRLHFAASEINSRIECGRPTL